MRKDVYNYESHQKAKSFLKHNASSYETTRIILLWSSSQQSSTSKQKQISRRKRKMLFED